MGKSAPTRAAAAAPANVTPFNFGDHAVRVAQDDHGQPWFVVADVAEALGYSSVKDAQRSIEANEKASHIVRTPGGDQRMVTANEAGLYALILRSRKPAAKAFSKWVRGEVLPALRQTGTYTKAAPAPRKSGSIASNTGSAAANQGPAQNRAHPQLTFEQTPQVPACQDHGPIDHTNPRNLPALPDGLAWPAGLEQAIEARCAELAIQSLPALREYLRRHMAYTARSQATGWTSIEHQTRMLKAASLQDAFAYQQSQATQTATAGLRAVQRVVQAALEGGRA